jgi:hypothetical protein
VSRNFFGVFMLSVIPEFHLLYNTENSDPDCLNHRSTKQGKEFVSFSDDGCGFEWKVTRLHKTEQCLRSTLQAIDKSFSMSLAYVIAIPDSQADLLSKNVSGIIDDIVRERFSKPGTRNFGFSAWQVTAENVYDLLLSTERSPPLNICTDWKNVSEYAAIKVPTMTEYQKLLHHISECVSPEAITVYIRCVLFDEKKVIFFGISRIKQGVSDMSLAPQIRASIKTNRTLSLPTNMSYSSKCLLPLLTGNVKPIFIAIIGGISDSTIVGLQALFDFGEKLCLTALPCHVEDMCEIQMIESISNLPTRRSTKLAVTKSLPSIQSSSGDNAFADEKESKELMIKTEIDNLDTELISVKTAAIQDNTQLDEIVELRSKNLLLKCEIDRLKLIKVNQPQELNAYTNHLLTEIKQLRQELLSVETERRKYLTSKRLVESLIEKSNKNKQEIAIKNARIEELKKSEKNLRDEMHALKKDYEVIGKQVEELENARLKQQQQAEIKPAVDSLYHQFLFPFNSKRDVAKHFTSLYELLIKIERSCALNNPTCVLDIRKAQSALEKIKDNTNELISASEKLEISCVTLLKRN